MSRDRRRESVEEMERIQRGLEAFLEQEVWGQETAGDKVVNSSKTADRRKTADREKVTSKDKSAKKVKNVEGVKNADPDKTGEDRTIPEKRKIERKRRRNLLPGRKSTNLKECWQPSWFWLCWQEPDCIIWRAICIPK